MKAYVCRGYGGPEVVALAEVPRPVPGDRDVLIEVRATTVSAGDWRVRSLEVPAGFRLMARLALGLARPRQPILGTELAGVVAAVGKDVTRFRRGDAVVAFPGIAMGAHAEYATVAEDGPVGPKPPNLSFEEAASLPFGGCAAMHFLDRAALKPGDRVLVIGASGAVGTALVQLARHAGAEVTGVTSTPNVALVRSLGASEVVDYTKEDFAAGGPRYDVVADTVETPLGRCRGALKPDGRLLAIAAGLPALLEGMTWGVTGGPRFVGGPAEEKPEYLHRLLDLARAGAVRPVVGRVFAFDQMREAHAHVATRRKRGSAVVRVAEG